MWKEFYKNRVNSTYQEYFETRYKPMLNEIIKLQPKVVMEEGCGIASISKYLIKKNVECFGFDIDLSMVDLAKCNTGYDRYFVGDILADANTSKSIDLIITHGVLEHFTDEQIKSIFNRYERDGIKS